MLEKIPDSIRRALEGRRPGIDAVLFRRLAAERELPEIRVRSVAFANMDTIPPRYTADGEGISPPLAWAGVPENTRQVVVIVEDADSPSPRPWVHAIAVLEGMDGVLGSGALPSTDHDGVGVSTGLNSALQHSWLPPDPPSGHGAHRYVFQVFALAPGEELSERLGRHEVEEAIASRATGAGWVIGTYERPKRQSAAKAIPEPAEEDAVAGAQVESAGALLS